MEINYVSELSFSDKELQEAFRVKGGMITMKDYELFNLLSSNDDGLDKNIERAIGYFGEDLRYFIIESVAVLKSGIENWLENLIVSEKPPGIIQGFNFGLFETTEGIELYLSGANVFSERDPDWPCGNDYWPEGRYSKIEALNNLRERLQESKVEPWILAQAMVIIILKDYFKNKDNKFDLLSGLAGARVATGFDDGDLYMIR